MKPRRPMPRAAGGLAVHAVSSAFGTAAHGIDPSKVRPAGVGDPGTASKPADAPETADLAFKGARHKDRPDAERERVARREMRGAGRTGGSGIDARAEAQRVCACCAQCNNIALRRLT